MSLFSKTKYAICSLTQRNIKTGQTKTLEWNMEIKKDHMEGVAEELDVLLRQHSVILKGKDGKAEYGISFSTEDIYKALSAKAKARGLKESLKSLLDDVENIGIEKTSDKLKDSLEGYKDEFEEDIKKARDKYGLFQTSTFIDDEGKFIETYTMTILED